MYVPDLDTVVTTVHVVFNEVVPNPTAEYFSELEKLTVKVDSQERSESDFQFLVGMPHLDDEDGLLYVTTRVVTQRGFIVAYRRLKTQHGSKTREEKVPIHVADIVRMTKNLEDPEIGPRCSESILPDRSTPMDRPKVRAAPKLTLTPSRKRTLKDVIGNTGRPGGDGHHPGEPVGTTTPALKRWNSEGRLATETPKKIKSLLNTRRTALRTKLSTDFNQVADLFHIFVTNPNSGCYHILGDVICPASYQKALSSPQARKWTQSMKLSLIHI